jgi:hypothetical protein
MQSNTSLHRFLFVAAALLGLLPDSFGATIDPKLAKADICGRYEVIHINGIDTTQIQALANRDAIAAAYGNAHEEHLIQYSLAYNRIAGVIRDLIDVFNQKRAEYPTLSYQDLVKAVLFNIIKPPLTQTIVDDMRRLLVDKLRISGETAYNDADLQEILGAVRSGHQPTGKMLLVPHSQGNLYANLVYDNITQGTNAVQPKSIAIMGVASPANTVRNGGSYVTSSRDVVINMLRPISQVLPSNVDQPFTTADVLGHNFIKIYLKPGSPARAKVLSQMDSALTNLKTSASGPYYDIPVGGFYYYGTSDWHNAGPGPDWPGPWIDRNGVTWNTPALGYSVPNLGVQYKAGSAGATWAEARASLQACYSEMIAALKTRRSQGNSNGVYILGCPDNVDGFDLAAWYLYSADYKVEAVSTNDYVYAGRHYSTSTDVEWHAACRR